VEYPLDDLMTLSIKIQKASGNYFKKSTESMFSRQSRFADEETKKRLWDEENRRYALITNKYMTKIGVEILPIVQCLLAEIEVKLSLEDESIRTRINPILKNAKLTAEHPTNPLGVNELSSLLMSLRGHLSIGLIVKPVVFVGYRYNKEDEDIAESFVELMKLEGLNVVTAKTAKPIDVDDKVKEQISKCDGAIIIFTKAEELKDGTWATSAWLLDEKAFTLGKGKEVGLFFEECISDSQKKGLQGNLEHVEFNRNHLEQGILKAIPYLRDFRQKLLKH
jgi:hypothetical protein